MNPQAGRACARTASSASPAERTSADVTAHCAEVTAANASTAAPASGLSSRREKDPGAAAERTAARDQAERRLLAAMSAGSRAALKRLHRAYFPRLAQFFRYLTATSATSGLVEDLITDTMFDVWRRSATFAEETPVYVSIMRLAYARGSQGLAEGGVRRGLHRENWLLRRREAPRDLPEVFAGLRVPERAVAYLVYSGHSRPEVADILQMSWDSVDAHLVCSMFVLDPWFDQRARLHRP